MGIDNEAQELKKKEAEIKPMDVLAMIDELLENKSELLRKFEKMLTEEESKREFESYKNEGLDDLELAVAAYNLPPEYKDYIRKNVKLAANHTIINYLAFAETILNSNEQYKAERELKEK